MVKTEIKSRERLRPDDIAKPSTAPSVFGHGVPSILFLCLRWLVQSFCRWQPGALTHPVLTDVPVAVVAASPTSCISCHRIPHSWKGEAEPSPTPPPTSPPMAEPWGLTPSTCCFHRQSRGSAPQVPGLQPPQLSLDWGQSQLDQVRGHYGSFRSTTAKPLSCGLPQPSLCGPLPGPRL